MARSYRDFFVKAQELREQLGGKAYLIDNYISCLLDAQSEVLSVDTSRPDENSVTGLYAICRASENPDNDLPHPFFKTGRDFIKSHPLDFQESDTRASIYIAMLADDYLDCCAKSYKEFLQDELDRAFDICNLSNLYKNICNTLGNEDDMTELNSLFHKRFMAPTNIAIFPKQLNNQLVEALAKRDTESSLQIFQLILNHNLFKETQIPVHTKP